MANEIMGKVVMLRPVLCDPEKVPDDAEIYIIDLTHAPTVLVDDAGKVKRFTNKDTHAAIQALASVTRGILVCDYIPKAKFIEYAGVISGYDDFNGTPLRTSVIEDAEHVEDLVKEQLLKHCESMYPVGTKIEFEFQGETGRTVLAECYYSGPLKWHKIKELTGPNEQFR